MNILEFVAELDERSGPNFEFSEEKFYEITNKSLVKDGVFIKMEIAQEECAELIQAISKLIRCHNNLITEEKFHVLEEMADVYICLSFIKHGLGLSNDDIAKAIDIKLSREARRLGMLPRK